MMVTRDLRYLDVTACAVAKNDGLLTTLVRASEVDREVAVPGRSSRPWTGCGRRCGNRVSTYWFKTDVSGDQHSSRHLASPPLRGYPWG